MSLKKFTSVTGVAAFLIAVLAGIGASQQPAASDVKAVLWEPVDISSRNLFFGPGGSEMLPNTDGAVFLGKDTRGTSLKYRIRERHGREWIVKIGREAQPEIVANRLVWAVGYKTEVDYLVRSVKVPKWGNYKNARFEARDEKVKRLDRWSWANNPFSDSRELNGLKVLMALINNWDLKDENTVVLQDGGKNYYVVADLGATFGKLADEPQSRSGRSVGSPDDFSDAAFIKGVNNGIIEFHYNGIQDEMMKGIKVEDARWIADLLTQLSDAQLDDAFRAANYDENDRKVYVRALRARINSLDAATKAATESGS
jgi:hypothetical protein